MPGYVKYFADLPFADINRLLGLELLSGRAHLSMSANRHIAKRHEADAEFCLTHLKEVISQPDFIDQEPHHLYNFELLKIIDGKIILVAIDARPDRFRDYAVKSCYLIPSDTLQRRIRKGHVQPLN